MWLIIRWSEHATRNGNYSECDWSLRGVNMQQKTAITQNVTITWCEHATRNGNYWECDHYVVWTCIKKRELLIMWSLRDLNLQRKKKELLIFKMFIITWCTPAIGNRNFSECLSLRDANLRREQKLLRHDYYVEPATRNVNYSECLWLLDVNLRRKIGVAQYVYHYVMCTWNKKHELLRMWPLLMWLCDLNWQGETWITQSLVITWCEPAIRNTNYSECDHHVICTCNK